MQGFATIATHQCEVGSEEEPCVIHGGRHPMGHHSVPVYIGLYITVYIGVYNTVYIGVYIAVYTRYVSKGPPCREKLILLLTNKSTFLMELTKS